MIRLFWLLLGFVSLGLGLIGVALPILPTVPFMLVAAFAFARSSARLSTWLLEHPRFGPPIRSWQATGSISSTSKRNAYASLLATFAFSLLLGVSAMVLAVQVIALLAVAFFIASRPST